MAEDQQKTIPTDAKEAIKSGVLVDSPEPLQAPVESVEDSTAESGTSVSTEEVSPEETVDPVGKEPAETVAEDSNASAIDPVVTEDPSTTAEDAADSENERHSNTPSDEESEPPTEEKSDSATEEPSEGMPDVAPVRGFTGEIVGQVVRLEDLQRIESEQTQGDQYDELMKLVEATLTHVTEHEIVVGRVVSIGEKDVVIDIGFKSDGIVSKNEFADDLAQGDEVEVFLERIEDYHGQLVLSKTKADTVKRWRRIEEAFESESVLEGTIVRRIKGGMIVELFDGVEAFLPGSQIDVRPVRDFDAYLEKRMEFKIVKLNPANENIVVSHKALIEKDLEEQRKKILSTMEAGQILEGIVKNITDFGVFIDLGGVDGLLHITDLSWGRVSHPSELVSLDENLSVVVLDYDRERQRISLGLKQLQPHPWENISEKFNKGDVVEGKVVSITDYGAFVELQKGIEGLVHISEMSWTEHIKHPSQMVSLGQIVNVKILNIDFEGKKISLGMKQLEPDPWDNIADRYPPGTVMRGKVRNITNFGVFVEIEPGIDGLVHISDLSWTKKVRHPSEMVKKGQELDVVVLSIDGKDRRISLGHKQVETNPWNQFATVYAEGTETEATVLSVVEKGISIELPLGVEGFLPVNELKNSSNHHDHYHEGDKISGLHVIRFDSGQKEIVVSEIAAARAKERAKRSKEEKQLRAERKEERRAVDKYTKAATGPATLGELSGLAELKAKMQRAEKQAATSPSEEVVASPKGEAAEEIIQADATAKAVAKNESTEVIAEEAPTVDDAKPVAEGDKPVDETADTVAEVASDEVSDEPASDDEKKK